MVVSWSTRMTVNDSDLIYASDNLLVLGLVCLHQACTNCVFAPCGRTDRSDVDRARCPLLYLTILAMVPCFRVTADDDAGARVLS